MSSLQLLLSWGLCHQLQRSLLPHCWQGQWHMCRAQGERASPALRSPPAPAQCLREEEAALPAHTPGCGSPGTRPALRFAFSTPHPKHQQPCSHINLFYHTWSLRTAQSIMTNWSTGGFPSASQAAQYPLAVYSCLGWRTHECLCSHSRAGSPSLPPLLLLPSGTPSGSLHIPGKFCHRKTHP